MRNLEKDEREMAERRELMLETGFRIFSQKSIEPVAMQEVADACGLGIATLYRYFSNKTVFVIAIATRKWEEFYEIIEEEYARRGGGLMNAAEELDFYLSSFIMLYREHADILRFNHIFNSYIMYEKVDPKELTDYHKVTARFASKFHVLYEKGQKDKSIRTDESEQKMFTTTMHIMLAVAVRFAQGVVYNGDNKENLTDELMVLKRMIMAHYLSKE